MEHSTHKYSASKFSPYRRATADLLNAANRKNMVHALLEIDIDATRKAIRKRRREEKKYLSLIGYIVYCTARAVDKDKTMHAYRDWRNRMICFEEVDVSTTIEREIRGQREVIPKIIRNANHKDMFEISSEIQDAKTAEIKEAEVYRSIRTYLSIPVLIRRLVFRILDRFPVLMKKKAGTIMVTSSGTGGVTRAWGIPVASHTLNITIGGMTKRVVEKDDMPQSKEHLCLTVSFDHDIIDGAPASRFIRSFMKLLETEIVNQKS
jgi:pyruvate/2-oxoglutarate dehydrogenase complex dihydrolipoamide acyltransferase (E2) component